MNKALNFPEVFFEIKSFAFVAMLLHGSSANAIAFKTILVFFILNRIISMHRASRTNHECVFAIGHGKL